MPLGSVWIAPGGRARLVRVLTEVDLLLSLVDTDVVWTSWSPTCLLSRSAKSVSSIPEPMILMVAADQRTFMPVSPYSRNTRR